MTRFSCVRKPAAFLLTAALLCTVGGCKPGGEPSRVPGVSGGVSSTDTPSSSAEKSVSAMYFSALSRFPLIPR